MTSRKYSNVEVKVGFFAAFCGALFIAMLVTYGRLAPIWRGRTEINVVFSDVAGLKKDAPVRYNGVEVGRVKWIRLLHLDEDGLKRLPVLSRQHLENLPLWPESVARELRKVSDEDFNVMCRRALKDRTMIELGLEVLQEGDAKRYRLDDQIRIVTTVFGDSAIEIISGNGAVNDTGGSQLIIGMSGDFFSNLAKSMGDVKDILSGVTDVVGAEERRSFERASRRLTTITARMDKIREVSGDRAEATGKKMDALSGHISTTLNDMGDSLEKVQPQARTTFEAMKANAQKIQGNFDEVQKEIRTALSDSSNDLKLIRNDINFAIDQSKPNFESMKTTMRAVFDDLGGLSLHLDEMRFTSGRLVSQSQPDIARGVSALKNSLTNLKYTGMAANENKDLMLSNRDLGEYEYQSALDIYRKISFAARRFREAEAEVQETLFMLADVPVEPVRTRLDVLSAPAPFVSKTGLVLERLNAGRVPLEQLQSWVEEKMLPRFERKKSAWSDDAVLK